MKTSKSSGQACRARLLTTGEVASLAERITGRRPSPSTILRWGTRGVDGKQLRSRRIGGRLLYEPDSIAEFFDDVADFLPADDPSAVVISELLGRPWGS